MGYHAGRTGGRVQHTVVIIAAHAFEARAAAGVGTGVSREPWGQWMLYRGELWDRPLAVIRCGPGKIAAAAATQAAIQYLEPAVVVNFGVAGSPDAAVPEGTLVIPRAVVDVALSELGGLPVEIPDRFEPDQQLRRALLGVPGTSDGVMLCWEGHVASPTHRPPVPDLAGTMAVDWESAAVGHVATMWDVPWAVLKVISDHGEPDRLRRLALVAKRPLEWGAEAVRRACASVVPIPVEEVDITISEPDDGNP